MFLGSLKDMDPIYEIQDAVNRGPCMILLEESCVHQEYGPHDVVAL